MYGKTGKTTKKSGRVYINRYYFCKQGTDTECGAYSIREDLLEEAFLELLSPLFPVSTLTKEFFQKQQKQLSQTVMVQPQKSKLEQKRVRWEEAYGEGLLSLVQYQQKLAEIGRQQVELDRRQTEQELSQQSFSKLLPQSHSRAEPLLADEPFLADRLNIRRIWKEATRAEKKHLVSVLVKRMAAESERNDENRRSMIYRPVMIKQLCFH